MRIYTRVTVDVVSERDVRVDRVGLDRVVRLSLAGRPIVATGRWVDDQTFEMDVDEGPGFHRYTMSLAFKGDHVEFGVMGGTVEGRPVATGG